MNELINHFQALYAIPNTLFMHYRKYDTTHPFSQFYNAPVSNDATKCKRNPTVSHEIKPNAGVLKLSSNIILQYLFFIIKASGYWDSQTLHSIAEHGSSFFRDEGAEL